MSRNKVKGSGRYPRKNEERTSIPPNFRLQDLDYAIRRGAVLIQSKEGSYLIKVNQEVADRLDALWAVDSVQK